MVSKKVEEILYKLVEHIGEYKGEIKLTGFLGMKGNDYKGELMVIGRATNGWGNGWLSKDVTDKSELRKIVTQIIKDGSSNDDGVPMQWVSACWGHRIKKYNNYNTKRSAFWRVIKEIMAKKTKGGLEGLGISDSERWPLNLFWSNLYKISPDKGGNPTSSLINLQLVDCKDLLKTEIIDAKPKRILMLTGLDWAQPFLNYLRIKNEIDRKNEYVEAKGAFPEQANCVVVVAKHPQGKPESEYVKEVIDAFQN